MKPYLICLLFFYAIIVSCNKKKDDTTTDPPYPVVAKLKTQVSAGGFVTNYEFDAQGRQTRAYNTSYDTRTVYTSTGLTETSTNPTSGMVDKVTTYTFNGNGQAIQSTNTLNPGRETIYEYNTAGYLLKQKNRVIPTSFIDKEEKYYYNNSNQLDSVGIYTNGGSYYGRYEYEYYPATAETLDSYNYGVYYLGKQQTFAKKKFTFIFGTQLWQSQNYTYLLDVQGRVVSTTSQNTSHSVTPPVVTSQTYTSTYY